MSTRASSESPQVRRIVVRVRVGGDIMAGTDDPVFLRLGGPAGREFRLERARGRSFQRGDEMMLVLAGPGDSETNVAHPELNDPTVPAIPLDGVESASLVKGMEPIPNVRGVGELDDRLLIDEAEVTLEPGGELGPVVFRRAGPIWLGLVSGLTVSLPRVDAP